MKVEIISVGDELLIGQTVNTNAARMGEVLSQAGFEVIRCEMIRDTREAILDSLNHSLQQAGVVLVTGGLGPTKDDVTKSTLAEFFGSKLVRNLEILGRIEDYFSQRGREILETNRQQADLPDNCIIIPNSMGTASGMWFEKNDKVVVSMPGVPYEMIAMLKNEVLPRLQKKFLPEKIVHRTILTQGIGESFLAEIIKDWETRLRESGLSLAYLPSPGIVRLRITGKEDRAENPASKIAAFEKELKSLVPQFIFGYENDRLEYLIGDLLRKKNATLSTAESCTGGYIAHLITSVPGSSEYYMGSVVSYANRIKTGELHVNENDLRQFGAVSKEVVEQMAMGIRKKFNTDYSIAVSGIAGPDGGTEEKPVGTVYVAVAFEGAVMSKKFVFEQDRMRNVQRTALTALNMLRKKLAE